MSGKKRIRKPIDTPVLDKTEAAEFLGFSVRTLTYLMAAKEVPFKRMYRRTYRFDRDLLRDWLRNGNTP